MMISEPQSMMEIISNSLKIYKKNFLLLMPISLLIVAWIIFNMFLDGSGGEVDIEVKEGVKWQDVILTSWFSFTKAGSSKTILFFILTALISSVGMCWMLCFVNDLISKDSASYKETLVLALKRLWRIVVLSITLMLLGILFFGAIVLVGLLLLKLFGQGGDGFSFTSLVAVMFMVLIAFGIFIFIECFSTISYMEVAVRGKGIIVALKKAIGASIKLKVLFRFFCLLMLLFFSLLLYCILAWIVGGFSPDVVVVPPLVMGWLPGVFARITISEIMTFILTLLLIPLYLVFFVNFYNDLILRAE